MPDMAEEAKTSERMCGGDIDSVQEEGVKSADKAQSYGHEICG